MQLNQGWRMLNNEIIGIIPMLPHFISITHPHGSQAAQIMTYIWKHDFFLPSMREKIIGLQIKMSSGRFIEIICAYFPSTPINSWVWVFWLFDNVNILFAGCYVLTDLCTLKCFTNYFMRRTWKERKLKLGEKFFRLSLLLLFRNVKWCLLNVHNLIAIHIWGVDTKGRNTYI